MALQTNVSAPSSRELIAFRVGQQEFCVNVRSVREIRGWTPATTLPHTPSYVCGVINLRGAVLPIIDLAQRLGFSPTEPTARHVIIVTEISDQLVGLLVDTVLGIITVTEEMVQPTPDVAAELARTFLHGVIIVDGRMVSLLGLDCVLPASALDAAA